MSDQPPVQRDEAWLAKASPEQITTAHSAGELQALQGLPVDSDGWPVNERGMRLNLRSPR